LLFKPNGRLIDLASRTVAVAATAANPMLSTTTVTLIDDSAKFACTATCDRAEHLAVTGRNGLAVLRQVSRCVLPEAIRDRGHRLLGKRLPYKDRFDGLAGIDRRGLGQVQVNHRGLQAAVTKILLDDLQRDTRFEKMGRIRIAQSVDRNFFAEVNPTSDLLHRPLDGTGPHGGASGRGFFVVVRFGGKQQTGMAVRDPVKSQQVQCGLWQRNVSIFGSLAAMDMHHHSLCIDIADLQVQAFLHAKSQRVDGPKVNCDAVLRRGVNDSMDLSDGDDFWQGLGVLQLHGDKGVPISLARSGIKEFDPREGNTQRSVGIVLFVLEVQEVSPELIFSDLVRRSLAVIGKQPDGA
jgi:hypothetical protein